MAFEGKSSFSVRQNSKHFEGFRQFPLPHSEEEGSGIPPRKGGLETLNHPNLPVEANFKSTQKKEAFSKYTPTSCKEEGTKQPTGR